MTLTVWGRASSSNVQPVMWALGELGIVHERIDVGGRFGGLDSDDFAELNPNREIPVLRDGTLVLWESRAILRYLGLAYGVGSLWPEDPAERAIADQWLEWAKTTVDDPFIVGVFWGFWRTPEADRNMDAVMAKWEEVNACMAIADRRLEARRHLCGESLTLADIGFACFLYRYFTLPLERPVLSALKRYYEALSERPAYRTHIMVDYSELSGRLDF